MSKELRTDCVVLYHADCVDGMYAGEVARRGLYFEGWEALVEPLSYEQKVLSAEARHAKRVVFVDICPDEHMMAQLDPSAKVTVIDHHVTRKERMKELGAKHEVIYDEAHSGCVLAYRHFFPEATVPSLLAYIEDRDLWRFALPRSRELNAWLQWCKLTGQPMYEMGAWRTNTLVDALADMGEEIERFKVQAIGGAIDRAHWRQVGVFAVPCCAMQYWESELCEALLKRFPLARVAANIGVCADGRVRFSVRSRGDVHVGELMEELFGGGGHKGAAGKMFESLAEMDRSCPILGVKSEEMM